MLFRCVQKVGRGDPQVLSKQLVQKVGWPNQSPHPKQLDIDIITTHCVSSISGDIYRFGNVSSVFIHCASATGGGGYARTPITTNEECS
jgi:hypothetical protein